MRMTQVDFLRSEDELRTVEWSCATFDECQGRIGNVAKNSAEFRKDWRRNTERQYKLWREELYPFRWHLRHSQASDETRFGLTQKNSSWDIWMRSDDRKQLFQVTLAYLSSSDGNPGYEHALRMEHLNANGHTSSFGCIQRSRRTRAVELTPDAPSRDELVGRYAEGVTAALENKRSSARSGGDLIVFMWEWLHADDARVFDRVVEQVRQSPVRPCFDRIHIFSDAAGCYIEL